MQHDPTQTQSRPKRDRALTTSRALPSSLAAGLHPAMPQELHHDHVAPTRIRADDWRGRARARRPARVAVARPGPGAVRRPGPGRGVPPCPQRDHGHGDHCRRLVRGRPPVARRRRSRRGPFISPAMQARWSACCCCCSTCAMACAAWRGGSTPSCFAWPWCWPIAACRCGWCRCSCCSGWRCECLVAHSACMPAVGFGAGGGSEAIVGRAGPRPTSHRRQTIRSTDASVAWFVLVPPAPAAGAALRRRRALRPRAQARAGLRRCAAGACGFSGSRTRSASRGSRRGCARRGGR